MVMSAKKESLEFYTEFLHRGGYIEVGTLNDKWVRITDQAMLERFYEANCLFRIPFRKEQEKLMDVNTSADLSKEEKLQLDEIKTTLRFSGQHENISQIPQHGLES
jgi:hypothetical protein